MFAGIFFGRADAKMPFGEMPVTRLGRHALAAKGIAKDGGAMAYAHGALRNEAQLAGDFRRAGVAFDKAGGLSAIALAAYRLWGESFAEKLEGRVTAVVIDVDAGRLVLARDRMGANPLYYSCRAASVAFSDDFQTVLSAPFVEKRVGETGLCELFALGPASTPGLTPVEGVCQVKPGCAIVADYYGRKETRHFTLDGDVSYDDEKTAERKIRWLVEDSMDSIVEKNPAVMLSGGLDSTILACLLYKKGLPVRAWSVEYEDNDAYYRPNDYQHDQDKNYVNLACDILNAQKNIVKIGYGPLADSVLDAGRKRGFPGMGDVDSSLMLFARSISEKENCALSGECADEVFGGYPWFHNENLLSMDGFAWSGSMALRESVLAKPVLDKINIRQYEALRYHESVASKGRPRGLDERENKLRLTHALCFEWFMPVLQLRAEKMCSCEGLEVITPFCDDRLAKYAYSLRWNVKNAGGVPKGILRRAFSDIVPESILNRRKSPYPKTHHPMYAKLVCDMFAALLDDPKQPINAICDADGIRKMMSRPLAADATPWFGQLMTGAQMLAYLIQVNAFLRDNGLKVEL